MKIADQYNPVPLGRGIATMSSTGFSQTGLAKALRGIMVLLFPGPGRGVIATDVGIFLF